MERDNHNKAGCALAHARTRNRRVSMTAAVVATLGALGIGASSVRAQTQDVTFNQSVTLPFNYSPTGIILNALDNAVDINQNGFNLTLTSGRLTKNGAFSSRIFGGPIFTGNGRFDFLVNAGTLQIDSELKLTQPAQGGGLFVGGQGTLILNSTSTANFIMGGINVINGGTLRIADDRNLGVREGTTLSHLTLDGGTLEVFAKPVTFDPLRRLVIGANGATLNVNGKGDLNLLADGQLRGGAAINKVGTGTLVLGGDNFDTFSGRINVNGGDLELRNARAISSRSDINLGNGGGLNLRSDVDQAFFNNDVSLPKGAPSSAVMSIDVGGLGGKGGNKFFLGALTINGGSLDVSNALADGSVLRFTGAANIVSGSTVNVIDKAVTWFDGQVVGSGALTKAGAGVLYLAGDKENTNAALTTVSGGQLRLIKNSPGVNAIVGDVLINGGTVFLDQSNQIGDGSVFNMTTGGFRLNSRNEQFSAFTVDGGSLTTGAGTLILTGGGRFAPLPGGAVGAPLPAAPLASLVINSGVTTVNAGGLIDTFSMQVSGGVNTVEAGGVLSVGAGGLNFTGTASPNITLNSDASTPGQLQLGGNVTFTGAAGTASISNGGAGAKTGLIDLKGATRTFTIGDGTAAVDTVISATLSNGSVAKSGAGILRLEGANNLSGLTINDGSVELANAGALGTAPVTLNAGTLRVRSDAAVTTFGSALTAADATIDVDRDTAGGERDGTVEFGGLAIGANRLTVVGANNRGVRMTGPVTLSGTAVFDATAPLTLSGVIGGAFGITKDGAGNVTLDGAAANTFSGTTRVQLGTLLLNKTAGNAVPASLTVLAGSARLLRSNQINDTSVVTVQGTGTLDVNGQSETIGTLTGAGGGSVTLGTGGVLTVTQGTFSGVISGAGMVVQENPLGGTSAAVVLNGTHTFTGGVLVNHGSVTFGSAAPQHVGTSLNGGTWGVYNGSSLNFGGASNVNTNFANVTLSGAGSTFAKFDAVNNNQGSFTITGGKSFTTAGVLANGGILTVGAGSTLTFGGTFTNTGTTTTTGTLSTTGAMTSSGTLTVSGPQTYGPLASLAVTGGKTTLNTDAGTALAANLAVTASGGELVLGSTQHLRSLTVTAPVTVGAAAPVSAGNKVLVTQAFSVSGGGKIDLTNNALVLDYSGAAGPALASVRDAVLAAYAGGTWAGNGLTSSTAVLSPASYGIGFGEASTIFGIGGASTASFRGQTVDATSVLARFTPRGDVTLDGVVNFDDLLVLAKNYNKVGVSYPEGDFDFSGNVNFDDLLVLAKNYNLALAEALPGAPAELEADMALAIAQSPTADFGELSRAVPEPSAGVLAVTAVMGGMALRRRRHGRAARP
jgi:autotransporter-associated beta strand protein